MNRETIFSPDRKYRYTLWREWPAPTPELYHTPDPHLDYYPGKHSQFVQFIGLNPSTADETLNDATVRRCINFAQRWGFGALCMTNLFALRETNPKKMMRHPEPEGDPENYDYLIYIAACASMVIPAWGNDGSFKGRDKIILTDLREIEVKIYHLGLTATGFPKHPLYLKKETTPTLWTA